MEIIEKMANSEHAFAGIADIVFLVDVTGSMQPCIDILKNSILWFIDQMSSQIDEVPPVKDWRARVVGYRDYENDSQTDYGWLVNNPFTRDVQVLKRQIQNLEATGGGPEPESLLDALMTVVCQPVAENSQSVGSMEWRPSDEAAHCIAVFTDASYYDEISLPEYRGQGVKQLYKACRDRQIVCFLYVPDLEQYVTGLGRIPKFMTTPCGDGADGLKHTMQKPENLNKLLDSLRRGISISASRFVKR